MLTSPTPAIRHPLFQGWGAAAWVALLCLAAAAAALPHAIHSWEGACTVVALLVCAAILGWHSRPQRLSPRRLELALKALRGPVVIQLVPRAGDGIGGAGMAYAAVARAEAGEVLLAHAFEPASVLAVARYWQMHLGVPLLPGWGLTKGDIEAFGAKRIAPLARIDYSGPSQHGVAGSVISLVCSAIALLLLAGSVAILREQPVSSLSLALLSVGVGLLVLLALATRTDVTRVSIQDTLEVERRCLWFELGSIRIPVDDVRLLAIVSPDGQHARHLVLAAAEGFWAIECPAALEPLTRGPVVALRPPLTPPPREREERAQRVVSGSGLH